jgi:hypothetical protein
LEGGGKVSGCLLRSVPYARLPVEVTKAYENVSSRWSAVSMTRTDVSSVIFTLVNSIAFRYITTLYQLLELVSMGCDRLHHHHHWRNSPFVS